MGLIKWTAKGLATGGLSWLNPNSGRTKRGELMRLNKKTRREARTLKEIAGSVADEPQALPMDDIEELPSGARIVFDQQGVAHYREPPVQQVSADEPPDFVERLERLSALRREGDLTDEEFAAAKGRLLQGGPELPASDVRATVDVLLVAVGNRPVSVINEVRACTGLGLRESKTLVDCAPAIVVSGASPDRAEVIRAVLAKAGAMAEIRPSAVTPQALPPLLSALPMPPMPSDSPTHTAYCVGCRAKREFKGEVITLANRRQAARGNCPVCGTKLMRILGKA